MSTATVPLVSVVTVVRNAARTLQRTFDSLAAQDWPRIEHVVVDGGSTDGTVDVIRKNAKRIAWWRSAPDGGISAAFNIGLARATGQLVGILSAGDAYEPGAIGASVAALAERPDAGFSFGACRYRLGSSRDFVIQPDADYAGSITVRMPAINHATVIARAELYRRHGGFSRAWRYAMDYELVLRWHRRGIVGVALERVLADVELGGVSQRRYLGSLTEVLRISLRHGARPLPAARAFVVGAGKHLASRAIASSVGEDVALRLRQRVNGRIERPPCAEVATHA